MARRRKYEAGTWGMGPVNVTGSWTHGDPTAKMAPEYPERSYDMPSDEEELRRRMMDAGYDEGWIDDYFNRNRQTERRQRPQITRSPRGRGISPSGGSRMAPPGYSGMFDF